ncbi:RINT1-like protein MAG2 [Quercus suber]
MDYEDSFQTLPASNTLSSSVLSFLNDKFRARTDLAGAPALVSELRTRCSDLDRTLTDLNRSLGASLVAYASFSDRFDAVFDDLSAKLIRLRSSTCSPTSSFSDGGGEGNGKAEKILGEELPALAKEVARVETVRIYAVWKDNVGCALGAMYSDLGNCHELVCAVADEMRLLAIKTLKMTEEVLTSVTKTRPKWARLVSAVDHRVDRALAVLRPQAIADHRALLASLGWPPPLSTLTSSNPDRKSAEVPNPLFTMQGDLKHQYCENFLALCRLQELQSQRKSRQLEGFNRKVALRQPLWAIEELVNPISLASQLHFSKWVDKPEFIFALVYKITKDYVDSMDELLQPLVDEAMLVGYSCREEWISAMVTSLSTYLAKEIFPVYVGQLDEESATGIRSQARISWLHLVDLMISFDKRVRSLVEHSGILLSFQEDGNLQKISSLSVFCDRPDWLDLWAEIELSEALDKLKPEMDDERNWRMKVQGAVLSSVPEDFKSPAVSSAFLRHLSSKIDRCRSLPSISLRSRFLRLGGAPITRKFLDCILQRCQEAEGLTALTDDDAIIKVANSINAAHYFESVIREWCEDVFFLEMELNQGDQLGLSVSEYGSREEPIKGSEGGIFDEEIGKLGEFRAQWVEKISVVILRGFDAQSRDYMKNRRQWQEKGEEGWTVSKSLVLALDYLQGKVLVVEESLNRIDFVRVWRSLAAGVDRLVFQNILMSNVKFYDGGVERFDSDLQVLFGVFGAWCLRPEGFFPKASEGLKLLKMGEKQLQDSLAGGEKWMKDNGIRHLSVTETEKILRSRVFKS